jgi:hypothetical protein
LKLDSEINKLINNSSNTGIKIDNKTFSNKELLIEYLRALNGIHEAYTELKNNNTAADKQLNRIKEINSIFKQLACPCCGEHWWNNSTYN